MHSILARRTRVAILAAAIILIGLASISLSYVLAPPPSTDIPTPLSQYGIVRVYASTQFLGNSKITITSQGTGPFFITRIVLVLNRAADFDILLDTISIDGTGVMQITGFSTSSKVVVVPAGLMVGDVISAIPPYLNFLLVKDPMGNDALIANGGSEGVTIGVRFMSGAYNVGTTVSAIATVLAPSNSTVTMTMS
ncbi:MAG: hypothetical protein ABSC50_00180 [Candidatus Bathyarchaeia archaeon]